MDEHDYEEGKASSPLLGADAAGEEPVRRRRLQRAWGGYFATQRLLRVVLVFVLLVTLSLGLVAAMTLQQRSGTSTTERVELAVRVRLLKNRFEEHYMVHGWAKGRNGGPAALERLAHCVETNTCGPGEQTVVLLASYRFGHAVEGGTSGEEIWGRSTMRAFSALNYTQIVTYGALDTLMVYQHLPDLVKVILWDEGRLNECIARNATTKPHFDIEVPQDWQTGQKGCMASAEYPQGIPYWKSFGHQWWPNSITPLGPNFTVAPFDAGTWGHKEPNQFLGLSIEAHCKQLQFYPPDERLHQGWILAKREDYFRKEKNAWGSAEEIIKAGATVPHTTGPDGEERKYALISTAAQDGHDKVPAKLPAGITSLGKLPRDEWTTLMSKSKVMLGIGSPLLSPSPFDALCMGVPFICPVHKWDKDDPENRDHWESQNDALRPLDPPYVYHVRNGDSESLAQALRDSAANPIDRFIPETMKFASVVERHRKFVKGDWWPVAEEYVTSKYANEAEWAHYLLPGTEADYVLKHKFE